MIAHTSFRPHTCDDNGLTHVERKEYTGSWHIQPSLAENQIHESKLILLNSTNFWYMRYMYIPTISFIINFLPPVPWKSTLGLFVRPKLLCIPLGFGASPQACCQIFLLWFLYNFHFVVSVEPMFTVCYCYKVKSEHTIYIKWEQKL